MQQKFIQIGNSKGLIISQELIKQLGFNTKEKVHVEPDAQTGTIIISKKKLTTQKIPSRLLTILDRVNKEYGPALKKLASL